MPCTPQSTDVRFQRFQRLGQRRRVGGRPVAAVARLAQRQHLVAADGEHLAQVSVDTARLGEERDQRHLAAAGLTELHRLLDGELVVGVDHVLEARFVEHPVAYFESRLGVWHHLHQHGEVHAPRAVSPLYLLSRLELLRHDF